MLTTDKHIKQFSIFYLACFVGYYAWSCWYGLTFFQIKPVFFYNQLDFTGNLILLTGIHLPLLHNSGVRILFDAIYLILPFITTLFVLKNSRFQSLSAILMLLFNLLYAFCFSIMSFVSIKVMLAFMTVPFIFMFRKPKDFSFAIESIRILFILFFFSTAVWKIRAGGIFNIDQMSGILLGQHNYLFLNKYPGGFKDIIGYLIERPQLSYFLYLAAFSAEFIFIIGFFTKRFDKLLIVLFILFALFNYMLMNINYFSWLPFAGCLYFAKFTQTNK